MFDQGTLSHLRRRTEYGALLRSELEPCSPYVTWSVPRRLTVQAVLLRQSTSVTPTCLPSHTDTGKVKTTQPSFFHCSVTADRGKQRSKCRKVPAPRPKSHPLLQVDFPCPTHAVPCDFQKCTRTTQLSSTMRSGDILDDSEGRSWALPLPHHYTYSHPAPWEVD